jgi:hypothetical protein
MSRRPSGGEFFVLSALVEGLRVSLCSPLCVSLPSQVLGKGVEFSLCSQCEHNRAGLAQPGPKSRDSRDRSSDTVVELHSQTIAGKWRNFNNTGRFLYLYAPSLSAVPWSMMER